MRTHEEFLKEMKKAHNCEEAKGRIFCVSVDKVGSEKCVYCHSVVKYKRVTEEELSSWLKKERNDALKNFEERKKKTQTNIKE